jgi:hypothetical protein
MSSDSTSKPSFSVGDLVRYDVAFVEEHTRGEGRVAGVRPLGDGSATLELVRTDGSGPIDIHDSWCSLVEEPVVATMPVAPLEVEEAVIEEIRKRRDAGRKKYGTSMEREDLTIEQWTQHAKEEALDFAIYLEKLKRELEARQGRQREDAESVKLDGTEGLGTFGGESRAADFEFADYGLDLGKVSVHGLTPNQAIQLACILVDHLVCNGHDFELRKGTHQDQYKELVCTDGGGQ